MARNKSGFPGQTPFAQAMNCSGTFIFDHGRRRDLDYSMSTRRIGPAVTVAIDSSDGVRHLTFSDEARDAKRAALGRRDPAHRQRGRS
jgi:hypothetical protein